MMYGGGFRLGSKIPGSRSCHAFSFSYRYSLACRRPSPRLGLFGSLEKRVKDISIASSHSVHASTKYWLKYEGLGARWLGYGTHNSSLVVSRSGRLTLTRVRRFGRRKLVWTTLHWNGLETITINRDKRCSYVSIWNKPHAVRVIEDAMSSDNFSWLTANGWSPTRPNISPIWMAWCSMI